MRQLLLKQSLRQGSIDGLRPMHSHHLRAAHTEPLNSLAERVCCVMLRGLVEALQHHLVMLRHPSSEHVCVLLRVKLRSASPERWQ